LWYDNTFEVDALMPPPSYRKANRLAAMRAQREKEVASGAPPSGDGTKAAGEKPTPVVHALPIVTASLTQEEKSKPAPSKRRTFVRAVLHD